MRHVILLLRVEVDCLTPIITSEFFSRIYESARIEKVTLTTLTFCSLQRCRHDFTQHRDLLVHLPA